MSFSPSFSHRIYCDAKFYELVDLLAGFLTSNTWVVDDWDNGYRLFCYDDIHFRSIERYGQIWPNAVASVVTAPAGIIAEVYGSAVFRVEHMRREWAQGLLKHEELPLGVRQRFEICPNAVWVHNSHIGWYASQKEFGASLRDWLSARGREAYICTFEGEFLDIINTGYKDPAESAEEIHKLVKELFQKRKLPDLDMSSLPADFIWLMPQLHRDSLAALQTAELIRTSLPSLPDCSAVVIEYCKSVEIELEDKVLRPLRDYWLASSRPTGYSSPARLKRLGHYIFRGSPKPLELGTVAVTIEAAMACALDPVARSLLNQLRDLPFSNAPSQNLVKDLLHLTRMYRNPAAHKAILSSEHLQECRDFVIGTETAPGLLARIVRTS
jgi:hypothetical protein